MRKLTAGKATEQCFQCQQIGYINGIAVQEEATSISSLAGKQRDGACCDINYS